MTILPSTIPLAADPAERHRALEQRCLAVLNRARLCPTPKLRRRYRRLLGVYRSTPRPDGAVVLELAATVLVLRERGVGVRCDGTVEEVLAAVLTVSRSYRYSTEPRYG